MRFAAGKRTLQGCSSIGRALVSKTRGCEFDSRRPCHLLLSGRVVDHPMGKEKNADCRVVDAGVLPAWRVQEKSGADRAASDLLRRVGGSCHSGLADLDHPGSRLALAVPVLQLDVGGRTVDWLSPGEPSAVCGFSDRGRSGDEQGFMAVARRVNSQLGGGDLCDLSAGDRALRV